MPLVRVTRRIDDKHDGRGYPNDTRKHLWMVDVATVARRLVTHEPVDHQQPQWSPDGRTTGTVIPNRNTMHAPLGLIDVESGETTLVRSRDGSADPWSWSPGGNQILLAADDRQSWHLDLFVYDVAARTLRRLTNDLPWQPDLGGPGAPAPANPVWLDDRTAICAGIRGGASGLYRVDTGSGLIDQIVGWPEVHGSLCADDSHRYFVQTVSSRTTTGEITVWDRDTGTSTMVTQHNAELQEEASFAPFKRFEIERGGFTIECWLLKPHGWREGGKYLLVLDIHGGPNGWHGWGFNPVIQSCAASGCYVLYMNPRGSGSYGRHFTRQVIGDWGGEDYRDVMAAVDHVCTWPDVDPARLGVWGYSYGSFMTSWVIGHTGWLAAAAIGAPVVDLVSFYGTSDIGHVFGPMQIGGTPWTNPNEYRARSPSTHRRSATTPALIVHGEANDRCPIGQGEQLFVGLLEAGVETEFVRYPGGARPFLRTGFPAHRADLQARLGDWFGSRLGAS